MAETTIQKGLMAKFFPTLIFFFCHCFCYSESIDVKDIIKDRIMFIDKYLEIECVESELDIYQHYYLIGCKNTYIECINLIELFEKENNPKLEKIR